MTKEWAFFTIFMTLAFFVLLSYFWKSSSGATIFAWAMIATGAFWLWSYG